MCSNKYYCLFKKKKTTKILRVIGAIFSKKKKKKPDVEIAPLCRSYGIVSGANVVNKY